MTNRLMRVPALLPIVLLLAGCDRAPDPPAANSRPVAAACVSRPEGTRWAGDYQATDIFGDTDNEAMSGVLLGGIVATDSVVYVLESGRASLWLLRPDLSPIKRVGREGDGPGEWRSFGTFTQGGSMRRVSASTDRVRIFDGKRVQEFHANGRFRRVLVNGSSAGSLSHLQSRVVYIGDTLFYSAGGYDPLSSAITGKAVEVGSSPEATADGRRPWAVRLRIENEDHAVLQLGVMPVPRRTGVGPAQALPLWDSNGECVVASDGAEPMLVYSPVGGTQDTMRVSLPDRVDRNENYVDRLGGLVPPGGLVEPSAATRIVDLILDPDGFVWLLPVQPEDRVLRGVEVLRVPLGGGRVVTDTVPAFPRAFGPPGVYFAGIRGANDELLVVRHERGGSANPGRSGGDTVHGVARR